MCSDWCAAMLGIPWNTLGFASMLRLSWSPRLGVGALSAVWAEPLQEALLADVLNLTGNRGGDEALHVVRPPPS